MGRYDDSLDQQIGGSERPMATGTDDRLGVCSSGLLGSEGHPGVEATVKTENGAVGVAICTAGISVGTYEIAFAYDGGTKWRGKGVMRAVNSVNDLIAPALRGMDAATSKRLTMPC